MRNNRKAKTLAMTLAVTLLPAVALTACGGRNAAAAEAGCGESVQSVSDSKAVFDADSAYAYVARQVEFGPRVPGSDAHRRAGEWLAAELRRRGAGVTIQRADLRAWDGTTLHAANIFAQFNPAAPDRLLLLAHYDTRPWADQDPDPAMRKTPVDGANDGASGVGVLLEVARRLEAMGPEALGGKGIDILLTDAEDYGTDGDEDSWALGTRWFAANPPVAGYAPKGAILLDMVGGRDARFPAEYFSRQSAAWLDDAFRQAAARAGHGDLFPSVYGTAVTDDHVELIKAGIPAIDIIDYRGHGFCPTWHTRADNMDNIDRQTLAAVGESLMNLILNFEF